MKARKSGVNRNPGQFRRLAEAFGQLKSLSAENAEDADFIVAPYFFRMNLLNIEVSRIDLA